MAMGQPVINDVKDAERLNSDYLDPPSGVGLNTEERRLWMKVVRANPHLNNEGYTELLVLYVQVVQRHREMTTIVKAEGYVAPDGIKGIKAHPLLAFLQKNEASISNLSTKLGISAAARANLGKSAKPKSLTKTGRPSVVSKLQLA